jgi:superfamily II DNA helicase RecQ
MKDIIDTKPTSIDELSEINKINQEQLDKYGEDIIAIVSKFK